MARLERVREVIPGPVTREHLDEKARAGWKLAAVEWTREVDGEPGVHIEELPYGSRVASDCAHLEENPAEMEVLALIMEKIVEDLPLGRIAGDLNRSGHRTRDGGQWTQQAVFNLLPRLVDTGPRILAAADWPARRPAPGAEPTSPSRPSA
jgi:hypothetical protein